MAVLVEQIEEGFRLVDSDFGPEIYQRYRVDNLQGLPDTWVEQAINATPMSLPKRGTPFPNTDYSSATCRFHGVEEIIDGASCFMFAIFRRGRWGAGGRRQLSKATTSSEIQVRPVYTRQEFLTIPGLSLYTYSNSEQAKFERHRFDRIETRWLPGDAGTVNQLQFLMEAAAGYIYTLGGAFAGAAEYLFLGGDAETDGYSSIRVSYQFCRWSVLDALDLSDANVSIWPFPPLGPFEKYESGVVKHTSGSNMTPWIRPVLMPIVRTSGTGPALPSL